MSVRFALVACKVVGEWIMRSRFCVIFVTFLVALAGSSQAGASVVFYMYKAPPGIVTVIEATRYRVETKTTTFIDIKLESFFFEGFDLDGDRILETNEVTLFSGIAVDPDFGFINFFDILKEVSFDLDAVKFVSQILLGASTSSVALGFTPDAVVEFNKATMPRLLVGSAESVPGPATIGLIVLGLAGLGFARSVGIHRRR